MRNATEHREVGGANNDDDAVGEDRTLWRPLPPLVGKYDDEDRERGGAAAAAVATLWGNGILVLLLLLLLLLYGFVFLKRTGFERQSKPHSGRMLVFLMPTANNGRMFWLLRSDDTERRR